MLSNEIEDIGLDLHKASGYGGLRGFWHVMVLRIVEHCVRSLCYGVLAV